MNRRQKTMRAVTYEVGGPELMQVSPVPVPELRQREILVRVVATAVNRADVVQRIGKYPPPPGESEILGLEAAGTVEEHGPGCIGKWQKGDRVMALLPGGGYAEFVAVHEDHIMPIPESYSFAQAAAIPETWLTAFQLLHTIGQVEEGQFVLVHAAGSGVGTAAIQLAKLAGARPIAVAGAAHKLQKAVELGAIGALNYKEGAFATGVLDLTGGRGADLVLDCIGASFWEQNANAIATDGRWVLYGLLSGGEIAGDILRKILSKRIMLMGTTLRARSNQYKADLIKDFKRMVLPCFGQAGTLEPVIDKLLPMGKIADAHRDMEESRNTGKIIILVSDKDAAGDHSP